MFKQQIKYQELSILETPDYERFWKEVDDIKNLPKTLDDLVIRFFESKEYSQLSNTMRTRRYQKIRLAKEVYWLTIN